MTDNEIIKALECCLSETTGCTGCPRFPSLWGCSRHNMRDSLDLINRQKAEMERLIALLEEVQQYNEAWVADNGRLRKEAKNTRSEAVKELVEIIVADYPEMEYYLDNLVKEFKEGNTDD